MSQFFKSVYICPKVITLTAYHLKYSQHLAKFLLNLNDNLQIKSPGQPNKSQIGLSLLQFISYKLFVPCVAWDFFFDKHINLIYVTYWDGVVFLNNVRSKLSGHSFEYKFLT